MTRRTRLAELESRALRAMRSRPARVIGAVTGLLAFVMIARRFMAADIGLLDVVRDGGVWGATAAVLGFAVFHVMAILTLRSVGADNAAFVWGVSQLIKYVPLPGAAVAGMAGAAVRTGSDGRGAVRLVLTSSTARIGAALVVGAAAVPGWLPFSAWVEAVIIVASAVLGWLLGVRVGGFAATTYGVVGWVAIGGALGALLAPDELVLVGGAYALAWVAGQLALPVPAGIGVRELVIVALLTPSLGADRATAVAISSRLVHTLSDLVVAVLAGRPSRGRRRLAEAGRLDEVS